MKKKTHTHKLKKKLIKKKERNLFHVALCFQVVRQQIIAKSGQKPGTNGVNMTRLGYPITNQHKQPFRGANNRLNKQQFEITKPKTIHYQNSILFKFDAFNQSYKAEEIINELEQQLPSAVLDAITEIRPIGSNKKWVIAFNNTIEASSLVDKTVQMYNSAVKLIDPNLDQSVKHAIIRIHWLPAEISDEDITNYIKKKIRQCKKYCD